MHKSKHFLLPFLIFCNITLGFSQGGTNCLEYLNSVPLDRTTGYGKETVKQGIYQALAQRYNSFTGTIDAVDFWSHTNPGGGDSNYVKVIIYQLSGFGKPGVILAQSQATVYADTVNKPGKTIAYFDPPLTVSATSIIISIEPYFASTDDFYVKRNIQGDGQMTQLSLVKQANVWYPNLVSNLGSEYDIDFLILPVKKSTITAGFNFTENNGNVIFSNTGTGGSVYFWDFGDGNFSGEKNPVHSYSVSGDYNAKLFVYSSDSSCTDTISKIVTITIIPCDNLADFSYSADSTGKAVFTDKSSGNFLDKYLWTFGDGQTSTLISPTHTYSSSGYYYVSLSVSATDGTCISTFSDSVYVFICNLAADFSFSIDTLTGSVSFSNLSTGNIQSYSWLFGDGAVSADASPNHTYSSSGNFNASLTLSTSDSNCSSTKTRAVFVKICNVKAGFSYSLDTLSGTSIFTNSSTGNIQNYFWDFGDSATSTETSPSHTYLSIGKYLVTLIVYAADSTCLSYVFDTLIYDSLVTIESYNFSSKKINSYINYLNHTLIIINPYFVKTECKIFDISGKELLSVNSSSGMNEISLVPFKTGLYLLFLNNKMSKFLIY